MPEEEEYQEEVSQEEETQEETTVDPQVESMQALKDELAQMRAELAESRKPVEPVVEAPKPAAMPKDYDADMIEKIVNERLTAALEPVAQQVQENERQRAAQLRDGLIGQIGGLTEDSITQMQSLAQRQFESGAASNMEEAVNNARLLLGIKETPKGTATQDARRAGRRGDRMRAPQKDAKNETMDDVLNSVMADHDL